MFAIGAGILMPLDQCNCYHFPPEKRGVAMGTMGITMILAPAIGPTLSGYIVQIIIGMLCLYDVYLRTTCFLIWISMVQNLSKTINLKQIIVVS